mgnify:FL=1
MLKINVKTAFYFFCGALWVAMLFLALELAAFLVQRHIEASNSFIVAYKQKQTIPHHESTINTLSIPVEYPATFGGWDVKPKLPVTNAVMREALANNTACSPFDTELRAACRKHFHGFTTQEKEIYTRIHGEAVLVSTAAFSIQHVYGADPRTIRGVNYFLLRSSLYLTGQLGTL